VLSIPACGGDHWRPRLCGDWVVSPSQLKSCSHSEDLLRLHGADERIEAFDTQAQHHKWARTLSRVKALAGPPRQEASDSLHGRAVRARGHCPAVLWVLRQWKSARARTAWSFPTASCSRSRLLSGHVLAELGQQSP
jgi:hypothetical protein